MNESLIVTAVGIVLVSIGIFKRPIPFGLIAALALSLSPAYGAFLIEGFGLLSILLILVVISLFSKPWNWEKNYTYPIGLLLILSFIIAVRNIYDGNGANAGFVLSAVAVIMFFTVLIGTSGLRDGFLQGFVIGGTLLAVVEIIRVAGGGAQHAKEVSFGVNPIVLGQFIAIAFIGALMILLRHGWRWGFGFCAIATFIGILATGSRGPMLAAVLAGLLLLILTKNGKSSRTTSIVSRIILLVYVGLIFAIIAWHFYAEIIAEWWRLDDSDGNASSRWRAWESAWATFLSNPLTGAGAGNYYYGESAVKYGLPSFPHQMLLEVGAEYGLGAALILIVSVVLVLRLGGTDGSPFVLLAIVTFSLSGSIGTSLVFGVCLAIAIVSGAETSIKPSLNDVLTAKNKRVHT